MPKVVEDFTEARPHSFFHIRIVAANSEMWGKNTKLRFVGKQAEWQYNNQNTSEAPPFIEVCEVAKGGEKEVW